MYTSEPHMPSLLTQHCWAACLHKPSTNSVWLQLAQSRDVWSVNGPRCVSWPRKMWNDVIVSGLQRWMSAEEVPTLPSTCLGRVRTCSADCEPVASQHVPYLESAGKQLVHNQHRHFLHWSHTGEKKRKTKAKKSKEKEIKQNKTK